MQLYDYYRSTASYRVRIALAIKGLDYEKIPVHLLNQGGEQHSADYALINPQHLVPTLRDKKLTLSQSIAIIEYLEECFPSPSLYPTSKTAKARVKSLSLSIACDIHPLNNLRVLNYLTQELNISQAQKMAWYFHWLKLGFEALEQQLKSIARTVPVCYGNSVSLADLCLIPQVYNANRFEFPMDDYPLIQEINCYCLSLTAFQQAMP